MKQVTWGKAQMAVETETVVKLQIKDGQPPHKAGRRKETFSPGASGGSVALLTHYFQILSLLDWERIHFSGSKAPKSWWLCYGGLRNLTQWTEQNFCFSTSTLICPRLLITVGSGSKISESTWFLLSHHPPASSSPAGPGGPPQTQQKLPQLSISTASCSSPSTTLLKSKFPHALSFPSHPLHALCHQSVLWLFVPKFPPPHDWPHYAHPSCHIPPLKPNSSTQVRRELARDFLLSASQCQPLYLYSCFYPDLDTRK